MMVINANISCIGDWSTTGQFQLQERDEYDRLTGYLTGTITNDQVQMKWMSADQSRLFDVKAFPERLIKIKSFKPAAEWIEIAAEHRQCIYPYRKWIMALFPA